MSYSFDSLLHIHFSEHPRGQKREFPDLQDQKGCLQDQSLQLRDQDEPCRTLVAECLLRQTLLHSELPLLTELCQDIQLHQDIDCMPNKTCLRSPSCHNRNMTCSTLIHYSFAYFIHCMRVNFYEMLNAQYNSWPTTAIVVCHLVMQSSECHGSWGGGASLRPPPSTKFAAHAKQPRFQPRRFMTFFFEVLRIYILTPSLRKSDFTLRSHMTFCDQMSTRKVRFFPFCVQNKWQSEFFILACKSVILSSFCFVYHSFSLILIQMKISNSRNHKKNKIHKN